MNNHDPGTPTPPPVVTPATALKAAARHFRDYQIHHLAKGPQDREAAEKADRNRILADMCDKALGMLATPIPAPEIAPDAPRVSSVKFDPGTPIPQDTLRGVEIVLRGEDTLASALGAEPAYPKDTPSDGAIYSATAALVAAQAFRGDPPRPISQAEAKAFLDTQRNPPESAPTIYDEIKETLMRQTEAVMQRPLPTMHHDTEAKRFRAMNRTLTEAEENLLVQIKTKAAELSRLYAEVVQDVRLQTPRDNRLPPPSADRYIALATTDLESSVGWAVRGLTL